VSTELAKYEPKTLAALDANIGTDLDGEPLRFKDGKWLQGFDKAFVEPGTVMRFAPLSIQDGYVKWDDGKPVDWRMREWISTQVPILREDLGENDEADWPNGKDPWAFTLIAALKDAEGTFYKFSTGSAGGINAVKKLMRTWRRERDRYPGKVPVVALNTDSYVHKVHKNTVMIPVFDLVGWEPWDESDVVPPPEERSHVAHAVNDEIPF
jgi:hypothetical protein